MFSQIFVNFLTQQEYLTPEQAEDVLDAQKTTMVRIGTLAEEERLMTYSDVEKVNRLQASQNVCFGDIAVEEGYLTERQLWALLKKQPSEHILLKQILRDKGYMSAWEVGFALNEFKEDLRVTDDEFASLQRNGVEVYIKHIAGMYDINTQNLVMNEFAELFITITMRLIDRNLLVKKAYKMKPGAVKYATVQRCGGGAHFTFAFSSADADAATRFACAYSKLSLDALDEDARDSLRKFLNCVDTYVVSELSNLGKLELDIEAPEYFDELDIPSETLVLPFSLSIGDFCVFVL